MIRRAEEKDIAQINGLLYQVHKVHSDVRPDLFKPGCKKYNDDDLKKIISNDKTPIFVYDENGMIEGYSFCIIKDTTSIESLTSYKSLYIDDLCVDESIRGKGIGKSLYSYVKAYAKEIGCYNLTLNVWADNKNALRFYESIGMHIQKIGMEVILDSN